MPEIKETIGGKRLPAGRVRLIAIARVLNERGQTDIANAIIRVVNENLIRESNNRGGKAGPSLSKKQVEGLFIDYMNGASWDQLQERYGIARSTISATLHGQYGVPENIFEIASKARGKVNA